MAAILLHFKHNASSVYNPAFCLQTMLGKANLVFSLVLYTSTSEASVISRIRKTDTDNNTVFNDGYRNRANTF